MIGIIDYKAGNAPSVLNALRHLDLPAALVTSAEGLSACNGLILPGVGSADATMESLCALGIDGAIRSHVTADKPFLGICVGSQVLFDHSEEGDTPCFGFLPGRVRRFPSGNERVPQMGWNRVLIQRTDPLTEGLEAPYFYFVNSYYIQPEDASVTLGEASYGLSFCALAARGRLYGAQFHAEKSAKDGLRLLHNFARLCGTVKEEGLC